MGLFQITAVTPSAHAFDPKKIGSVALWLDAQDPAGDGILPSDASSLTTWVDKSGKGNTFNAVDAPTFYTSIINSKPGIRFNGSSNYLVNASTLTGFNFGTGDFSFYLVVMDRGTSNAYTHYIALPQQDTWALKRYDQSGSVYRFNGSTSLNGLVTATNTPYIASFVRRSGNSFWRWDNYEYSTSNIVKYPGGVNDISNYGDYWTAEAGISTPGAYGGDWGLNYSASSMNLYQVVTGFRVGTSYTASVTVSNYGNGTIYMYVEDGTLVNTNIGGNGTFTASFTATSFSHTLRFYVAAGSITASQVQLNSISITATTATDIIQSDTQSLSPTSANIGHGWTTSTEYSASDMGEVIVYNGTLSEKDHNNVHNYLKNKWGL